MKRINDIGVSDEMYNEILNVRRRGSKCYLTRPEPKMDADSWAAEFRDSLCINCEGIGSLALQVIVGGPYGTVPSAEFKDITGKNTPPRATFIDGNWYKQKTQEYTCPVCHGTGAAAPVREPTERLVF